MRECDNSKIHISSNFLLSICPLIITQKHFATPHHTSVHLLTLHFLSFTLHYPLIWLNSIFIRKDIALSVIQSVSRLVDIAVGGNFLGLCNQKFHINVCPILGGYVVMTA